MQKSCCRSFGWILDANPGIRREQNTWKIYNQSEDIYFDVPINHCPYCGKSLPNDDVEVIQRYFLNEEALDYWCPTCNAMPDTECISNETRFHEERKLVHTSEQRSRERFENILVIPIEEYALTSEDSTVYTELYNAISEQRHILLDFSSTKQFSMLFANTALGKLCQDFSLHRIRKFVTWFTKDSFYNNIINIALETSAEYYSKTDEERERIDACLSRTEF